MKAIKTILGLIRKADQKYNFFEENDRILVGVSGGKDSMILSVALNMYQKFKFVNFSLEFAILDLGFPGFVGQEIQNYFKSININLHIIDCKDVYKILKIQQGENKHLPCSICSRMKKAAINKTAKQLHCNKVAFAHHVDDAIETLFLNEIYGGRIATFQPKMHLDRMDIVFIRPLILTHENEIIKAMKEENIPYFSSHCPNDGNTKRAAMKNLLKSIYEIYPSAKDNFVTMLSNYEKETLFYQDIFFKIERKNISLKLVTTINDCDKDHFVRKTYKNIDAKYRYLIYKKDKLYGVTSLNVSENNVTIEYPLLIRKNENLAMSVLNFVIQNVTYKINPVNIKIININKSKEIEQLGFIKDKKEKAYIKQYN